jgi:hypothetical protein
MEPIDSGTGKNKGKQTTFLNRQTVLSAAVYQLLTKMSGRIFFIFSFSL